MTPDFKNMNPTGKRFRVALSFPGAKREYVQSVADGLAQRFGEERVLYDRFHTAEFANPDLAFDLPDLYRKDSDLIVVVLRGDYVEREWCGLEWRAIYAHIKEGRSKQVMLFRADQSEIRGLSGLEGFVPGDAFAPDEAVTLILQRLAVNEGRPRDFYLGAEQAPVKPAESQMAVSRLPRNYQSAVFEGREKVLAALDALWADALADSTGRALIVSLVAVGGAGKTTVASRWKDALLARDGYGGVERYFDWSFYSQGTRAEAGGASAQTAADATVFVAAALKFFGDPAMADSTSPSWDKGARLAALIAQHRTLLILDGLEPLQHPPGPQMGELKDDAIRALFAGLQNAGRGLCLVTTREPIADLAATRDTTTPEWRLDHLTDAAGALVLNRHGVTGPNAELQRASAEVKGHALTLALMGRYLKMAFHSSPDISRRDCFHFEKADARTQNGHAFRIIAAYEKWLESEGAHVELAILRLLGLFDRRATPDCITALCTAPAIPGLTEALVDIEEQDWETAVTALVELDLIETAEWAPVKVTGYGEKVARAEMEAGRQGRATELGAPQPFRIPHSAPHIARSIDAHPLLREYFDAQLEGRGIASAAHSRLYEHLCASVPYWPEGRDGLLPLYQAVAHGCKAGRFEEALMQVYIERIKRASEGSHAFYSTKQLGLFGLDLAAVSCFFVEPWRRVAAEVPTAAQAWLLSEAAFNLRATNRLAEARGPMHAANEIRVEQEDWVQAAGTANNLSQLELTLGDVPAADVMATQSIDFADRSGDAFMRQVSRVVYADVLHQAGRLEESCYVFSEAESIQVETQPKHPLLHSLQGFQYCDILLTAAERSAWRQFVALPSGGNVGARIIHSRAHGTTNEDLAAIERRAATTLQWVTPQARLLDIGLDNLTLGRVYLLRAILESSESHLPSARTHLDAALAALRKAGMNHFIPAALLPCAWVHALLGEWDATCQRLDEAFAVATRGGNPKNGWQGGMRLHLVDTLLHRARIFGVRSAEFGVRNGTTPDYPWPDSSPAADLALAEQLINDCGYHRRNKELADADADLAALFQAANRLVEAERHLRRALTTQERSFGPDHPEVATVLDSLGQLLQETNRMAEAEPLLRRALVIDEGALGSNHPSVARDLNNLARLLNASNRLAEAEPLVRRALVIDEHTFGSDHASVARGLNNLGELLVATNRLAEAEPILRRALAIDESRFGVDHPTVAKGLNILAQLLQATNRLTEAEPLLRRALVIDEGTLGSNHSSVARDLNSLAQLLLATNRLGEAESVLRQALVIDERILGNNHPSVARDLNNLAQLLLVTNRPAEAESVMRRALVIDESTFGSTHPSVARDLNNLARLLLATNRLAEAEPLHRRLADIFENLGDTTGLARTNQQIRLIRRQLDEGQRSPATLVIDTEQFFRDAGFRLDLAGDTRRFLCKPSTPYWNSKFTSQVFVAVAAGEPLNGGHVLEIRAASQRIDPTIRHAFIVVDRPVDDSAWLQIAALRPLQFLAMPVPSTLLYQGRSTGQPHWERTSLSGHLTRFLGENFDPFDVRDPVFDVLNFFGREALTESLAERLGKGRPIGLFGLRKIGKSSLMRNLQHRIPHPTAWLDLQAGTELQGVYDRILHAWDTDAQDRFGLQLGLNGMEVGKGDPSDLFAEQTKEAIAVLSEARPGAQMVILLDEIELIMPPANAAGALLERYLSLLRTLRGLVQEDRRVSLMVAGVDPTINRTSRCGAENVQNPFFKLLQEEYLPPLLAADCIQMVRNIGQQVELSISDEAAEYLVHASGGHPSLARQLCSLVYRKRNRQPGEITLAQLQEAADQSLFDPQYSSFLDENGMWGDISNESVWTHAMARANQDILTTLAEHHSPVPQSVLVNGADSPVRRACLYGLRQLSVIQSKGEQDPAFAITFGLLRSWIRQIRLGLET